MGSKSRSVTVGYKYHLGMHVICCQSPIDGVSDIRFTDRSAWQGMIQDGQISINRPELFGGQAREGGVAGFVDVEGGSTTQTANDYLSTYLRPGELIPAYRGVFGLVFRRFYFGNNPYIKPLWLKLHNIFNTYGQWLPGLAPIGTELTLSNCAVHIALDCSTSMAGTAFTNQIAAIKAFVTTLSGYTGVSVRVQPFGSNSFGSIERFNVDAADATAVNNFIDTLSATATNTDYDVGITGAGAFFASALSATGLSTTSSDFQAAATGTGTVGTTGATENMRQIILFLSDGEATSGSDADALVSINAISGDVDVYGVGLGSAGDLATIDNTPQDGIPVITSSEDQITNILSGAFNLFTDLNPAHILRDVLISPTSDGSGDTSEIGSTFATVAQTLFDEGLGLSFFWQNPSDKESFKANVERHISGVCYRDNTGVWQIKLIRPDYTVGSLVTYDDSKIVEWLDYEKPQQAELPNSITVVYTRRDNGEEASVTLHNVAAIQSVGRVINEKLTFEGVTRPSLANKIAQRELIAKTQPLAKGSFRAAYLDTTLNLGSAFIVNEPRMGINNVVCRITEIEEGDPTDNSVIIRFVEDVFAFDTANDSFGSGEDPVVVVDDSALPSNIVLFEEVQYYDQVLQRGQTEINDALTTDPGLGNWQIGGDRPNNRHINAEVVRYDYPNWINVSTTSLMPVWVLSAEMGRAADVTTFTAPETTREGEVAVGARIQIDDEIMRVDSVSISSGVATFTVGRGCLDTVPRVHAAGSYAMLYEGYTTSDGVDYTDGESIKTRFLPRTSTDTLLLGLASDNDLTMASRAFRPLPVGQLQVDGSYEPSGVVSGLVSVTWAHRSRLLQTTTSIDDHTAGDIGPEAGVSYILVKRLIDSTSGGETVSHTEETALSPAQVTQVYVDVDDSAFSAYAGANTIAMEIGIKTVRETSPQYENWQTPFVRFETAFAGPSVSASPSPAPAWADFTTQDVQLYAPGYGIDAQAYYVEFGPKALKATLTSVTTSATVDDPYNSGAGTAFLFNNSGDKLLFADQAEYDLGGDFTISLWYNRAGAGGSTIETLVSKYNATGDQRSWVVGLNEGSNDLVFRYSTDGTAGTLTDLTWAISGDHNSVGWNHIYIERSGSSMTAWFNGTSLGANSVGSNPHSGTANVVFGAYESTSTNDNFNGYIAEAIIENSAMGLGGTVPTAPLSHQGGPAGTGFRMASKSSIQGLSAWQSSSWATAEFDILEFDHYFGCLGSNTEFTVPAALNGQAMVFFGNINSASGAQDVRIQKSTTGGSTWTTIAQSQDSGNATSCQSGVEILTTGDIYRMQGQNSASATPTNTNFSGWVF